MTEQPSVAEPPAEQQFRYFTRPNLLDYIVYSMVRDLTTLKCRIRYGVEFSGTGRVPKTGPVLIVANHESDLDPALIASIARRQLTYVAKKELWDNPIQGWFMDRFKSIPVERGTPDRRALTWAIEVLQAGEGVIVFPEGARSRSGELMPPKAGAGMIWAKTRVPLLPVYIDGTYEAKPIGEANVRPRRVRIAVGQLHPFPEDFPLDRGGAAAYSLLSRFMMNRIAALKARLSD
jgi:1-acyl-sn-glycerol-3-phosphate acyltransferase